MRTAFAITVKCPKDLNVNCQTYTVFVFVTYTHRRVFHLSLSGLLSDYFTVGNREVYFDIFLEHQVSTDSGFSYLCMRMVLKFQQSE